MLFNGEKKTIEGLKESPDERLWIERRLYTFNWTAAYLSPNVSTCLFQTVEKYCSE
jgi:hypothetical protein